MLAKGGVSVAECGHAVWGSRSSAFSLRRIFMTLLYTISDQSMMLLPVCHIGRQTGQADPNRGGRQFITYNWAAVPGARCCGP